MGGEYPFVQFGGVDLRADPQDAGPIRAIDLLDVDLDRPGRVRSRDGYNAITGSAASDQYTAVIPYTGTDGTQRILATAYSGATGTQVYNYSTGAALANAAITGIGSYALFGTTANKRLYFVGGTAGGPINRLENSTFTAPAGMPASARFLAVTPWDNRLVAAYTSVVDRVEFSDVNAAETWSGNTIDLTPGDGEQISGMVAWRDKLFVFKNTKFFVFFSTTDNGAGVPVFNYTTVANVTGMLLGGVCGAGPDGVYYQGKDYRIYRTTGGVPVEVSAPVSAWLQGTSATITTSPGSTNAGAPAGAVFIASTITSFKNYVYFTGASPFWSSSGPTVVYDTQTGNWMIWNLDASCINGSGPELLFGHRTSKKLMKMAATATTDNGTAIAAKWRSGFWPPVGSVRAVDGRGRLRGMSVDGWGTVNLKMAVDDGSLGSAATLALGVAPAYARAFDWRGTFGRNFSYELSSANIGPWFVESARAYAP